MDALADCESQVCKKQPVDGLTVVARWFESLVCALEARLKEALPKIQQRYQSSRGTVRAPPGQPRKRG